MRNLLEKFQPFRRQVIFELSKTGSVATRSRQAIDEARADGIANIYEYNRDDYIRIKCELTRSPHRHWRSIISL